MAEKKLAGKKPFDMWKMALPAGQNASGLISASGILVVSNTFNCSAADSMCSQSFSMANLQSLTWWFRSDILI
eukprot:scaffold179642_cov24-Prasinocladus_malaysianus.AAC.3